MLEAIRQSLLMYTCYIFNNNIGIGHIHLNFFGVKAKLDINGKTYKVYRKPRHGIRWGIMPPGRGAAET